MIFVNISQSYIFNKLFDIYVLLLQSHFGVMYPLN